VVATLRLVRMRAAREVKTPGFRGKVGVLQHPHRSPAEKPKAEARPRTKNESMDTGANRYGQP
jgi:hypothetical protein